MSHKTLSNIEELRAFQESAELVQLDFQEHIKAGNISVASDPSEGMAHKRKFRGAFGRPAYFEPLKKLFLTKKLIDQLGTTAESVGGWIEMAHGGRIQSASDDIKHLIRLNQPSNDFENDHLDLLDSLFESLKTELAKRKTIKNIHPSHCRFCWRIQQIHGDYCRNHSPGGATSTTHMQGKRFIKNVIRAFDIPTKEKESIKSLSRKAWSKAKLIRDAERTPEVTRIHQKILDGNDFFNEGDWRETANSIVAFFNSQLRLRKLHQLRPPTPDSMKLSDWTSSILASLDQPAADVEINPTNICYLLLTKEMHLILEEALEDMEQKSKHPDYFFEIKKLRDSGSSYTEIGKKLGISRQYAQKIFSSSSKRQQ